MAIETNIKGKLVKWYFENAKSIVKTPREYKCFYNTKKAPTYSTFIFTHILYIMKYNTKV